MQHIEVHEHASVLKLVVLGPLHPCQKVVLVVSRPGTTPSCIAGLLRGLLGIVTTCLASNGESRVQVPGEDLDRLYGRDRDVATLLLRVLVPCVGSGFGGCLRGLRIARDPRKEDVVRRVSRRLKTAIGVARVRIGCGMGRVEVSVGRRRWRDSVGGPGWTGVAGITRCSTEENRYVWILRGCEKRVVICRFAWTVGWRQAVGNVVSLVVWCITIEWFLLDG